MAHTRLALRLHAAALAFTGASALAANGLVVTEPEALWPQWQARIAVHTGSLSPVSLAGQLSSAGNPANAVNGGGASRGLQGGALFGDYYFARPSFGAFRASGGLLIGSQAGAPLLLPNAASGNRLNLAVNSIGANVPLAGQDNPGTVPYLGVGFTGAAWHSLAITADLGLVAERPSNAAGMGRALFGSQGMDNALRDMRLSPVLQLGVRYAF